MPAKMPPAAEVISVTDETRPACAFVQPNSAFRVVRAKTYNSTSIASSMNPSCAAHNASHRGVEKTPSKNRTIRAQYSFSRWPGPTAAAIPPALHNPRVQPQSFTQPFCGNANLL
ncbi:MAG: hypothetical protein QM757_43730 [Paludibaculum sp.]